MEITPKDIIKKIEGLEKIDTSELEESMDTLARIQAEMKAQIAKWDAEEKEGK